VLSSSTAFSLGGGCGRSNLIDFPFINANRPQILRITGTTQQVITLGIAGTDLYDSVDCAVQGNGQVLYMLTNRTLKKLEFRREQGGLLQLVRDNFGQVITPFVGGMRPSLSRVRRPLPVVAPEGLSDVANPAGAENFANFETFFSQAFLPSSLRFNIFSFEDDASLSDRSVCVGPTVLAPIGFTFPLESAVTYGTAIGSSRNDNVLWGDYYVAGDSACTLEEKPESYGPANGFGLYSWTGVVASQPPVEEPRYPFNRINLIMTPKDVTMFEDETRTKYANPFAGRGGPVTGCLITATEFDAAELAIGPGPSNTQVQHSLIPLDILDRIFGSSMETVWGGTFRCE
jgi:hypothetical protein